jgi:hypothetical protein
MRRQEEIWQFPSSSITAVAACRKTSSKSWSRHLTIGWSLKPDYGHSGQPYACRVTPYFAQHRVARPRSSNRGSYVSLELPETSLVAPAGPSPRRLLRANPLPQPRRSRFSGSHRPWRSRAIPDCSSSADQENCTSQVAHGPDWPQST